MPWEGRGKREWTFNAELLCQVPKVTKTTCQSNAAVPKRAARELRLGSLLRSRGGRELATRKSLQQAKEPRVALRVLPHEVEPYQLRDEIRGGITQGEQYMSCGPPLMKERGMRAANKVSV